MTHCIFESMSFPQFDARINRGFEPKVTSLATKAMNNINGNKYPSSDIWKNTSAKGENCVYDCKFIYHRLRNTLNFKSGGKCERLKHILRKRLGRMENYWEMQNKLWKDGQSATGGKISWLHFFHKHVKALNVKQIVCGFHAIIKGSLCLRCYYASELHLNIIPNL